MNALDAAIFASSMLALAACGLDDGALSPRGDGVTSAPFDAGPGDAADEADAPFDAPVDAPVDAPPPKRTVTLVNPFGGPPDNLLADGDFEWSITTSGDDGQYGWRGFSGDGASSLWFNAETGGLCHSGTHCGVLEPGMILFGRGTAAGGSAGNAASLWLKPPGPKCGVAQVLLLACDDLQGNPKILAVPQPDASGWCHFKATVPVKDAAQCLYIKSFLKDGETALVDSATLLPDVGNAMNKGLETTVPSAELLGTLKALGDTLHRTTPLGARRAPPFRPSP